MMNMTSIRTIAVRFLGLSALLGGVLLLAAQSSAKPAAADAGCTTSCTVEVEFRSVVFPKLDDCTWGAPCDTYEQSIQAYGSFAATTWKSGVFGAIKKLKMAGWGDQPSFCPSSGVSWTDGSIGRASCFRNMGNQVGEFDPPYYLSQTFLCTASSNTVCNGGFAKNNNRVRLTVKPGEMIFLSTLIYDYDSGSSDDVVCNASKPLGPFTAQQLASLNLNDGMSMAFNGDGACSVYFTVKHLN